MTGRIRGAWERLQRPGAVEAAAAVSRVRAALDAWRTYDSVGVFDVRQLLADLDAALDGPAASDD